SPRLCAVLQRGHSRFTGSVAILLVMPIEMPSAPPYAPSSEPPWIDQWPPAPPPVEPPPVEPPRRARGALVVLVISLACALIGFELGGALFGSPSGTIAAPTRSVTGASTPTTTAGNGSGLVDTVDQSVVDINTTLSNGR